MASSEEGGEPTSKLRDIVLDMMVEGKSREEILNSLQDTGLSEEESESVYKKIKEEYEEYIGERLDRRVKQLFQEQKKDMMSRVDSKLEQFGKDIKTKRDLKFSEQEEYIDKKVEGIGRRVDNLQDELYSLRTDMRARIKEMSESLKKRGPSRMGKKAFSIIIILIGVLIITYPLLSIQVTKTLMEESLPKGLVSAAVRAVSVVAGLLVMRFGVGIYSASKGEKLKEIGQEWIE